MSAPSKLRCCSLPITSPRTWSSSTTRIRQAHPPSKLRLEESKSATRWPTGRNRAQITEHGHSTGKVLPRVAAGRDHFGDLVVKKLEPLGKHVEADHGVHSACA